MPTYQGGVAVATASASTGRPTKQGSGTTAAAWSSAQPGTTTKTRPGGVAVTVASGSRGVTTKTYRAASVPSCAGASAPTGRPTKAWPGRPAVVRTQGLGGITIPVITDAQFDEAERRPERWPAWALQVDWTSQDFTGIAADLSDTIRSVEVERSITGELPDESGVVDGYATGVLTANLGGRRRGASLDLAAELSPFRADSPLAGKTLVTPTCRFELGLLTDSGEKTYRQLTGPVRTLRVAERDQSVRLTAVDPSERIRELITLPTFGEFVNHAMRRNWAITVNTQWIVDHVLRANGVYPSPPPRADAIISCTGHGGLASEIGYNGSPISQPGQIPKSGLWTDDSHPYRMLGSPEPADLPGTVGYIELYGITDGVTPPFRFVAGNGVGLAMLLHHGSWLGASSSQEWRVAQIRPGDIYRDNADNETPRLFVNAYGNGDIYAGLVGTNGSIYATPRIPTGSSRWRQVGTFFRMVSSTSLEVTVRCDATTRVYTITIPAQAPPRGYRPTLQVNPQMTRSWSNLQAWVKSTAPTLAEWQALEAHVPQADVGRGINELLYLPDVAAQDSWEVLKAAVGAEFGVHGFTEAGRYFFRPRTDTRSSKIDVDISVDDNLAEAAYELSSDSVRNVIGYASTPRYHDSEFQAVVTAKDVNQFVCRPGITRYELDWPWGAAGRHGGTLPYYFCDQSVNPPPQPQWSSEVPEGYSYSYGNNFTGERNIYNVGVTWCRIDHRRVRITVNNTGDVPVRLATDASAADPAGDPGEPALHLGGWPMITLPDHVEEYRDEASIKKYRSPRALALGTSEWRQTPGVLDPVARELLAAMSDPVPVLENLPVRGNPRVQVGQVARCTFRGGTAASPVVGVVVKTHRTLDKDGITDLVSVRPLPEQPLAPAGWTFYIDISHHQQNQLDLRRVYDAGYSGCVARIGQGGGSYTKTDGTTATLGQVADTAWTSFRDQGRALWGSAFAGYWYVGNTETPAAQAQRCRSLIGDTSIPIMLDFEDGSGEWSNLLACIDAFRAQGLKVTMLYTNLQSYATQHGATNIDATGLALINSRYWLDSKANPAQNPSAVFADMQATRPRFGFDTVAGGTVDALQFTDAGVPYPGGPPIDIDAFPGTAAQLARMFAGLSY